MNGSMTIAICVPSPGSALSNNRGSVESNLEELIGRVSQSPTFLPSPQGLVDGEVGGDTPTFEIVTFQN